MSLKEEQLKNIKMMNGGGLRNSVEGKITEEKQLSEKEDSILPPLTVSRGKSSGVANSSTIKPSKFLRRNFPPDIQATQPKGNFLDSYGTKNTSQA